MNGLDKDNTYVLLIGASIYPNWHVMDIPNVQVNLREFKALLSDPFYCGISSEKITIIEDESLEDTNNAIQEFFDSIQNSETTILLYYSGHGLLSAKAREDLFLATKNIREKTFEASSIKITELRKLFSDCSAKRKILLLDCCYAGKVSSGFMGTETSDSIAKLDKFEGTYIMAASSEYERARFDPAAPNSPTKFTGKFIDIIKNGIDSDGEYCTLNSLYNQIRNSISKPEDGPMPVQIGQDNIGSFPIFRNKKFVERVSKDEQTWNKIVNSNSINAYNTFIDQYPESKYNAQAVKKIKDIEDDIAWRKACNKNTIGGYREYLNNYDNRNEDAKKRLKDLSTIEQENEIWQNANVENNVKLFEEYRNNYPNGRYIDQVKIIIEKLTRSEREESGWNSVDKENISALNEYLVKYPSGKYYNEATLQIELLRKKDEKRKKLEGDARLKKLEEERKIKDADLLPQKRIKEEERKFPEEKFWDEVCSTNTVKSFKKYLSNYPQGKFADGAKAKIEELEKASKDKTRQKSILTSFLINFWELIIVAIITIIVAIIIFKNRTKTLSLPNKDTLQDSIPVIDSAVSNPKLPDTIGRFQPDTAQPVSETSNISHDYLYYFHRGYETDSLRNYSAAIANYTKALQLKLNDRDAYFNRGIASYHLKNYTGAIADFTKILKLDTKDGDTYLSRGNAYFMLDKFDEAIEDYSSAIKLNSHLPEAYVNRGDSYRFLSKLDKACEDYKKAEELGSIDGKNDFAKFCSISIDNIDVEITQNFIRNDGKKGMNIYAKFNILNADGQKGQINAYFYLGDHNTQLKDNNNNFSDEDGYVSTWKEITPKYKNTSYNIPNNTFPLFIPYTEMDLDTEAGKTYALSFYILVHINDKIIIRSKWYDFNLSF